MLEKFGRNQKIAIFGYLTPFAAVVLPAFVTLGGALFRGDSQTQLAVIDKLISFAQVYGLVAVSSILVVAGAIKGVGSVAQAIMAKNGDKP